jgi:hypothetical protein
MEVGFFKFYATRLPLVLRGCRRNKGCQRERKTFITKLGEGRETFTRRGGIIASAVDLLKGHSGIVWDPGRSAVFLRGEDERRSGTLSRAKAGKDSDGRSKDREAKATTLRRVLLARSCAIGGEDLVGEIKGVDEVGVRVA